MSFDKSGCWLIPFDPLREYNLETSTDVAFLHASRSFLTALKFRLFFISKEFRNLFATQKLSLEFHQNLYYRYFNFLSAKITLWLHLRVFMIRIQNFIPCIQKMILLDSKFLKFNPSEKFWFQSDIKNNLKCSQVAFLSSPLVSNF